MKVKTESRSPAPKPVQSALNSAIDEKTKSVKTDKHDKVKTGKAVKLEKKGDKKMDGLKKEKKEKKADGVKTVKKHVDSDNDDDDDAPLVRFNLTIIFFSSTNTCLFFFFKLSNQDFLLWFGLLSFTVSGVKTNGCQLATD